jgi:predicted ester cyclase
MKNFLTNCFLVFFLAGSIQPAFIYGQNLNSIESNTKNKKWTDAEREIIKTIERFLFVAGNYNLEAMDDMIIENAIVGIVRIKDGKTETSTLTIEQYFEDAKNRKLRPYFEPVMEYTIHVDDGHLAFVRADAILHAYGVPKSNNIDYFTLIKENGDWKFLSLAYTLTPLPEDERVFDLNTFGKSYAQALCSQRPDFVSLFYTGDGSLSVNNGTPAVGRDEISKTAESFMTAFPDIIVSMDSLVTTEEGVEFHWTFTGTNTGPNGTGNNVKISGYELWQLDDNGLIKESRGSFDAEEYERQLKYGVDE